MNNKIIPPLDNRVEIIFEFTGEFAVNGLSNFEEIILTIGSEVYSTTANPTDLYHTDNTTLTLDIGDSTELLSGLYIPKVVGYNSTYDDGYGLTGSFNNLLESPISVYR